MRKIFLLLGLACSVAYSQTPIDYESTSHITTTNTTDYIPVFRDTPSKALFTMTAENAFPWIYSGGYVRPRTIGYNLMLGTSSDYAYKLYTGGLSFFSDNMTLATGKRLYLGSGSYAYESGSDIHFYSSVAGDNTLANLASVNDTISDFYADTITINTGTRATKIFGIGSVLCFDVGGTSAFSIQRSGLFARTSTDLLRLTPQSTAFLSSFPYVGEGDMYYNTVANKVVVYNGTSWDTLSTGASGGGGVVDTAGGQVAGQIAYWTDKNTLGGNANQTTNGTTFTSASLRSSIISDNTNFSEINVNTWRNIYAGNTYTYLNPTVSNIDASTIPAYIFNTVTGYTGNSKILSIKTNNIEKVYVKTDSSVFNNYLVANDSLYLKYLGLEGLRAGSVWITNSPTGAADSANTELAYIGWEMKDLPTLEEYEKDVKMINGHMERRVWYIDYETKELKSQYGWAGLGMMNTQSAYMIYHEITVRWMFEQNKKLAELEQAKESDINLGLDVKFLIGLLVFVALMGLIVGFRR